MDCTARGRGNERVEEGTRVAWVHPLGSSTSGSDDDGWKSGKNLKRVTVD